MTDLTPKLKAAGWKPISEIRQITFNNGDKVELVLVDKQGRKSKPTIETPTDIISYEVVADYRDPDMFRRLIPVTPDTIVLSREDANNLIDLIQAMQSEPANLPLTDCAKVLIAKLQQLGGSDV